MKHTCLLIIIVNVLLSLSQISQAQAQAPNLGTTAGFALFTAVGAIVNTGPTFITGHVGTNSGAISGFPPGVVMGTIYQADATTLQVANDVVDAYDELSLAVCDSSLEITLGNNQVLTPKVYCVGEAATMNGNLILDGQNDPSAIFIFKIDGAFSTTSFSNIALINEASIANVYWLVNGAYSLGSSATFTGTVIASGAISLGELSSLQGRGLTTAGMITLDNSTVTRPLLATLPIELVSFVSDCIDQKVVLKWSTASESNNDYYSIERSIDGSHWVVAGKVTAAGNSTSLKNYSYTDIPPVAADIYYRLKQTDINGRYKYFKIIKTKNCKAGLTTLEIYPNPATLAINLIFNGQKDHVQSIDIYNATGSRVYSTNRYQSMIDIADKPSGIYTLHLKVASKIIIKKFIIRRGL